MFKKYRPSHIPLLFVFALLSSFLSAQEDVERCGTVSYQEQLMQDPGYAEQFHQRMSKLREYQEQMEGNRLPDCPEIIYIPVAVHFQETGLSQDCMEQMAVDQVESMSADFTATNDDITQWTDVYGSDWPNTDNDGTCFRFCLATLNHPEGSGIAEGDYAITSDMLVADNAPMWSGYFNFFVRGGLGGVLGYSPLGGQLNGDGVVCAVSAFGSVDCDVNTINAPYDLGRTMTHEVGHYFSLSHPFDSGNCAVDGDGIDDTPFTSTATYGCPNGEVTTCTDPLLWPTYMEYCDDACLFMFSADQVAQMNDYVAANLMDEIDANASKCQETACVGFSGARTVTNETCAGGDGAINFQTFNGNAPFEFSIDGGANFLPTTVFNNVSQGTYDLVIQDAEGCEWMGEATVNRDPAQLNIVNLTPSFCGEADGEIHVSVQGGGSFNYFLNGQPTDNTGVFTGISGGVYDITVAGNNGCLGGLEVTLPNEDDLDIRINEIKPVTCSLFDNGSIDFRLGGGVAPFSFVLNEGVDSSAVPFFGDLAVGPYNITVVDARNCRADIPFQIFQGTGISPDCPCEIFAPSAFTIDHDDLNEYWQMYSSCPVNKFELLVFGRNGQIVFETNDITEKWNGGASADYYVETELFYYRLRFSFGGEDDIESVKEKTGYITVMR